jgi:hypothetical protein
MHIFIDSFDYFNRISPTGSNGHVRPRTSDAIRLRVLPARMRDTKRRIERLFSEANRALEAANRADGRMCSDVFVVNHFLPRVF